MVIPALVGRNQPGICKNAYFYGFVPRAYQETQDEIIRKAIIVEIARQRENISLSKPFSGFVPGGSLSGLGNPPVFSQGSPDGERGAACCYAPPPENLPPCNCGNYPNCSCDGGSIHRENKK